MLSLLRSITPRQPALLRHSLATYTTSKQAGWEELHVALFEQGENQVIYPKDKKSAGGKEKQRLEKNTGKWKAFKPNRIIRPYELTYKSRFNEPSQPTRKADVGPPPNVARYNDIFHQLDIDPLSQAQNPAILSQYVSQMGKIYSRNITGLTSKTQRRLGKAIRRAKMMGVIPVLSKSQDTYNTNVQTPT